MRIARFFHLRPATMSAVGAIVLLLAWMLDTMLVERLKDINTEIARASEQSFDIDSFDALNRKLKGTVSELEFPKIKNNELDSQVNEVSVKLDDRRALDDYCQDVQRRAQLLVSTVHDSIVRPADIEARTQETADKIYARVRAYADAEKQYAIKNFDASTEAKKREYVREANAFLEHDNQAAGLDEMVSLSNELSSEADDLQNYISKQRDSRELESKIGNIISGLLFFLGTVLTVYGQWRKDVSDEAVRA